VIKRPAVGLRSRYASAVIGASLTKAMEQDQPLSWESISFDLES